MNEFAISTHSDPVHCLIIEDHPLVLDAMVSLLQEHFPNFEFHTAEDTESMVQSLRKTRIELILLDLMVRDGFALNTLTYLKQQHQETKVIVYSSYDDNIYARRAYLLGADGYVNKRRPVDFIIDAIKSVLAGNVYFQKNALTNTGGHGLNGTATGDPFFQLTSRELDISILMVKGLTTSEIGDQLNIAKSTVSTHKTSIFDKLNVKNILELRDLMQTYKADNL